MRRAAIAAALVAAFALHAQQQPPEMKASETITVERILIDARVTLGSGDHVLGLTAKDFKVRIDGKPAVVESVEWIPETAVGRELLDIEKPKPAEPDLLEIPEPQGRLIVVLFQTDFSRESVRVRGQMKIQSFADDFVESLEPEDRVAVFSYDSHLKFRLDFSDNHEKIKDVMRESLMTDEPLWPRIVPSPSLAKRLDKKDMKDAATPEKALFLIGNALRPIPGPKSLVLFGWGLGQLRGGRVHMGKDYMIAQRALEGSRTTVFAIDLTQADFHSLAPGLAAPAYDTGGFYAETFNFPYLAMDRLKKTMQGHYELEVRKPELKTVGVHEIEVDVVGHRDAFVMARRTYLDKN
jgi:VWFA-related protein